MNKRARPKAVCPITPSVSQPGGELRPVTGGTSVAYARGQSSRPPTRRRSLDGYHTALSRYFVIVLEPASRFVGVH
jgi:hypothetical protein